MNLEDDNSIEFVDVERPPGRKAEKYKKRRSRDMENESSNSYVKLLQEIGEEKKQQSDKKLQLLEKVYIQGQEKHVYEQEKLRLEQMKEDDEKQNSISRGG
ncbi:MAG: hypothetical protein Q8881_02800 [Sweet potato little leaf phytoplasma]|nr:hypothetical protein [Sweet potato little leaf phytoplasma]